MSRKKAAVKSGKAAGIAGLAVIALGAVAWGVNLVTPPHTVAHKVTDTMLSVVCKLDNSAPFCNVGMPAMAEDTR